MQYRVSAALDPPLLAPIYASRAVNWRISSGRMDDDDDEDESDREFQWGRREGHGDDGRRRMELFLE